MDNNKPVTMIGLIIFILIVSWAAWYAGFFS